METWLKLSIWVAVYGFLKECQPIDPYITQYLVNPPMNFTETKVNQEIFPVATYSCLIELVLVFLLTDWLKYRPVIFINGFSYIMVMVLLIWFRSLQAMWVMEVFYGTTLSTEVAYYTYIYTKVDKEHYQAVTSYMRTSALLGRFSGCILGQILFVTNLLSLLQINYIQFAGAIVTFFWAFLLPPVQTSLYFYRYDNTILNSLEEKPVKINNGDVSIEKGYPAPLKTVKRASCSVVIRRLWDDFRYAYINSYTLKWSLWWSINYCGFNQEGTYVQLLWQNLHQENNSDILKYTGFAESAYTIIGAISAFSVSYVTIDWEKRGDIMLCLCSLLQGLLVFWSSQTIHLWQAFVCHIMFAAVYYFSASVAYSEIAKHIPTDSYALIFGINSFFALILQTILTAIFTARGGLELASRHQFAVYGIYFLLPGFGFLIIFLYKLWNRK